MTAIGTLRDLMTAIGVLGFAGLRAVCRLRGVFYLRAVCGLRGVDEVAFGDFDGDGVDDVFNANGTRWAYSSGGRSSWIELNGDDRRTNQLAVADFNNDDIADVFTVMGQVAQ